MRFFPVLLLFVSTLRAAAPDGVVRNVTSGIAQANATVSLFQVTQQGPQMLESIKSDAQGKFQFSKDAPGPKLIQAVYGGVVYNRMIPPGMPASGVEVPVYESSKKPGEAKVDQHMLLLEPGASGTLSVSESYVFKNSGNTTWNDPDSGTLQFALPAAANGKVEINATGPGSVPVRKAADPGPKPNTYKLDFPVKPGESRVDLTWSMPFNTPGVFEGRTLYKGEGPTRIVAPKGVTLKGDGVQSLGTEPQSQATIYGVKGATFRVAVEGTGVLRQADDTAAQADESNAPKLTENLPKLYGLISNTSGLLESAGAVKWVLFTSLGMLAFAFVLLYRKGNPHATMASNESQVHGERAPKARNARGRG